MASLKVKVSLSASMLEARVLVKLGRFSGEELAISSLCTRLAVKLNVYGKM